MPADTFSSILGWLQIGTGNDNNTWGVNHNNQVSQIFENAIAGQLVLTVTGGTLDLSGSPPPAGPSQVGYSILTFAGTLTANQTVKVPNLTNRWIVFNNTGGAGSLSMQTPTGSPILIPQGTHDHVWCDGANVLRRYSAHRIGEIFAHGGTTAPPGSVACNGAALSRAIFSELYAKIATTWGAGDGVTTFNVPNLQDTARFLRSSGAGLSVGLTQAQQVISHAHNVTISVSGATGGQSNEHTHTYSGTTASTDISHTYGAQNGDFVETGGGNYGATGSGGNNLQSNNQTASGGGSHTHTYSGSTGNTSQNHTHNFSATSAATSTTAVGGSETRPEAAVVLMCIRI
jgi:microcystin-dependent protein